MPVNVSCAPSIDAELLLHIPALNVLVARAALSARNFLMKPRGLLLAVTLEDHVERLRRVLLNRAEQRVRDVRLQIAVLPVPAAVAAAPRPPATEAIANTTTMAVATPALRPPRPQSAFERVLALRAASPERVRAIR